MSGEAWDANARARLLDERVAEELERIELARDFHGQLRFYLQRMTDRGFCKKPRLEQLRTPEGHTRIGVGPPIYRAPCQDCLIFKSGARLSFGITLRADGSLNNLVSYRFHLQLLQSSGLQFVRIDLNDLNSPNRQYEPLEMPRSHIHPGFENVHVPFPVMHPLDVLDRIFHVIEPRFTR